MERMKRRPTEEQLEAAEREARRAALRVAELEQARLRAAQRAAEAPTRGENP